MAGKANWGSEDLQDSRLRRLVWRLVKSLRCRIRPVPNFVEMRREKLSSPQQTATLDVWK